MSRAVDRIRKLNREIRQHRHFNFTSRVAGTFGLNLISLAATGVSALLIARRLGPEGKGLASILLVAPGTIAMLFGAGMAGVSTYLLANRAFSLPRVTQQFTMVVGLITLLTLLLITVLWSTGVVTKILAGATSIQIAITAAAVPSTAAIAFCSAALQGIDKIKAANVVNASNAILTASLMTVALLLGSKSVTVLITMSLVGTITALAYGIHFLRMSGGSFMPAQDAEVTAIAWYHGKHYYLANLAQYLNYRLDLILLGIWATTAAAGYYAVAVRLSEILLFLPGAFAFVLLPDASRLDSKESNKNTVFAVKIILVVNIIFGTALWILAPQVIQLLFTKAYLPSVGALRILIPGAVALSLMKPISALLAGRGLASRNGIASLVTLAITLSIDVAVISRYGFYGVSWGSTLGYFSGLVVTVIFVVRLTRRTE